jgi:hypothetical protein
MMITKTTPKGWMLSLLSALCMLVAFTACSSSSDSEDIGTPVIDIGEVINNPTKVKQYENTKQFQSDLDALVTYAISLQTFRLYYWALLSSGFENGEAFNSPPEFFDEEWGTYLAEAMYDITDEIAQNSEQYSEAFKNLHNTDILPDPTIAKTRGWVADGIDFAVQCRHTQTLGRKSVMAILRNSNMATNPNKLKELFNTLPSSLRSDYKDYAVFWNHFSAGKLDARANQIFVNLYNFDADFTIEAKDMGVTPGKNMVIAGTTLMKSGMNLLIDASPISTQLGYGKDLYGAIDATADLITKGDVKGFIETAINNAITYGPVLDKGLNLGKWEGYDLFDPDEWKLALSLEVFQAGLNEVIFKETFQECMAIDDDSKLLIPNLVTSRDENGKEVLLVCIVDQKTGCITVGFSMDKEGKITMNPKTPGTKQITVVGKDGKRKTKTVIIPEDKPTEVVVDLDEETLVEEEPENGYLELRPSSYVDELGTSGTYDVWVYTNYLYYSCKTDSAWLSATAATDINKIKVRMAENNTGKERKGSVTVVATNKDGKVLKRAVFVLRQMPKQQEEGAVWTTPSSLKFGADGGIQELEVSHSFAYPVIGCAYGSGLDGWTKISWKETSSGYNIVVDASANNTDQERSGTLVVYAATTKEALDNVLNGGSIDPALVVKTEVLVKQEAPTVGGDIESIDFYVNVAEDESGYSGSYKNHGTLNSTEGTIKTTRKGDGLHVECAQQIDYIRTTLAKIYDITVSFDIDDVNGIASKTAKIMNLKYHSNVQVTYYIDSEVSGRGTDEEAIEVTNIPMSGASTWIGTSAGGVKFSNFVNKGHVDWVDMSPTTYNYTYVEDPANEVQVTIHFK